MKNIIIPKNLFDLSADQKEMSQTVYDGKVLRCLVAPYHSYMQLEKIISYSENTYLLPEREMSYHQTIGFISLVVNNKKFEEVNIITSSMTIIGNMINDCVRILTEKGEIVNCDTKTFMANIHTIRYEVLENKYHAISDDDRSLAKNKIDKLIKLINEGGSVSKAEYKKLSKQIEEIGEPIISTKLNQMLRDQIKINMKS